MLNIASKQEPLKYMYLPTSLAVELLLLSKPIPIRKIQNEAINKANNTFLIYPSDFQLL